MRAREAAGACRFTLLVPRPLRDPDTEESAITLELAIALLEEAAGGRVEGLPGDSDPLHAVSGSLASGRYDKLMISTLRARLSHFDVIAAVASLHHMDAERALARMNELPRPRGVLVVIGLARSRLPKDLGWEIAGALSDRAHRVTNTFCHHPSPII